MFDWVLLKEKSDKWKKLFDDVAKLIGNDTIKIEKTIECLYKIAPETFAISNIKEIKVDNNLIKGDIILVISNLTGQDYNVAVSKAFEGKAFGKIANPEIVLLKIKEYLKRKNKKEKQIFASLSL